MWGKAVAGKSLIIEVKIKGVNEIDKIMMLDRYWEMMDAVNADGRSGKPPSLAFR